jgi:putative effector of murein hydrolase
MLRGMRIHVFKRRHVVARQSLSITVQVASPNAVNIMTTSVFVRSLQIYESVLKRHIGKEN